MKIRSVHIQNFKMIRDLKLDFFDSFTGKIRPVTALFGDNGSGKTTVLQAIALTISMATYKTRNPREFQWHGFLADRIGTFGDTRIEVELQLDEEEVEAVHAIFGIWKDVLANGFQQQKLIPPLREQQIKLVFENGAVRVDDKGFGAAVELLGRFYTKVIMSNDKSYRKFFDQVGDVFWFDQYRNLGSGSFRDTAETDWKAGVEGLREFLIKWWTYHLSPRKNFDQDFIALLEERFSKIFRGAKFAGTEPMETDGGQLSPDFYFLIERNHTTYDLSEMSSGEQAVFCVLYDFVRLHIAKSIVLIDELELHLHPPEQQSLYNNLQKLGPDCQYIITSHSPYLYDIIPAESRKRLEGGRLC